MLTIGSLVKINPSTFGENPKHDDMFGDLGYVGVLMHLVWQVSKIEKDSSRGEIAWCKITNPDVLVGLVPGVKRVVSEGEAVLLVKDLIPASMKITLDYYTEEINNPHQKEITALFSTRKKMQNRGKDKTDSNMKKNWKEIENLRARAPNFKVKVILPKHSREFIFDKKEIPDVSNEEAVQKFKSRLAFMVRSARQELKIFNPKEVKTTDIFGVGIERRGGVFTEAGSLLKAYEESLKIGLKTPKKPVDKIANYVGIEIEFIYKGDQSALDLLLIKQKLNRYVDLTTDGSVKACHSQTGYQSAEMRVLCKMRDVASVLSRLANVFNHPKIDAYTNRTCGLHVHVDMRNRAVNFSYKNFVRVQNLLRGSQPVGRISNTHCKANTKDTLDIVAGEETERYSVVNAAAFKKHQTLEIRIHEGTTNCEDILNWVNFIDAVASHTSEIPSNTFTKASEIVTAYGVKIPMESIKYVDSRIERFNSLSAG